MMYPGFNQDKRAPRQPRAFTSAYRWWLAGLIGCSLLLPEKKAAAQMSYGGVDGRTNVINTAVPFLRITPDARRSALGDAGIALSPDANSVFSNLSQIPFAEAERAVSGSFTPWLRSMASDVYLASISAYKKLDSLQAIGIGFRYFNLGTIQLEDFQGMDQGQVKPGELSLDAGYARKLSEHWSVGIAFRYIHSKLASGTKAGGVGNYKAGNAFASDVSLTYTSLKQYGGGGKGTWRLGAVMSNIGTKISYSTNSEDKYFLPANLGIGGGYTYQLDNKNALTLTLDINKLLAPTPDTVDGNKDGIPDYRQKGILRGTFGSFGDAPGGLSEELHELMYATGAEYTYGNLFALRAGYYNEHKTKGNRKYLSAGFGLKYNIAALDFSYLIPAGGDPLHPLANTLRVTVAITW
ncbi:type IX secretion system outer membrane channel protein PorV [Chitinophaga sp. 30R24]|uniref:type IX secretion system outer membrane channel protein PorV n=1 Tax=Chitinophaga sp. 30R24 TaxID=3248838 RepID=UPI003B92035B